MSEKEYKPLTEEMKLEICHEVIDSLSLVQHKSMHTMGLARKYGIDRRELMPLVFEPLSEFGLIELVKASNVRWKLSKKGNEVKNNGGFKKFYKELQEKSEKEDVFQQVQEENLILTNKNLKLQNENAEYEKTIQDKKEELRQLNIDNGKLTSINAKLDSGLKLWKYITIGATILSIILGYLAKAHSWFDITEKLN